MVLPLDLCQEFLDIVQTSAGFQSHFAGLGLIGVDSLRFFNNLETGTKCLIDHPPEGSVKPLRNRSRSIHDIIVYGQCRSHIIIMTSFDLMSMHMAFVPRDAYA